MAVVIPPHASRAGDPGHPDFHNNIADVLTLYGQALAQQAGTFSANDATILAAVQAQVATANGYKGLRVTSPAYAGGADPTGTNDSTAAIQAALNAATPGTFVYGYPGDVYKTSAPLIIPDGVAFGALGSRPFAIPTGNYGIGGLPVIGMIIKPAFTFSGSQVIYLDGTTGGLQHGGQYLTGFAIDGSSLPGGNTVHGIEAAEAIAGLTIRDVLVFKVGGKGLYGHLATSHPPDFWYVMGVKVSACGGNGIDISGVADSYWVNVESTGNGAHGWAIGNCGNSRFLGCKSENQGAGSGYVITSLGGFTGTVTFSACTSSGNNQPGWVFAGPGTGTYLCSGSHTEDGVSFSSAGPLVYGFGLPELGNGNYAEDVGFAGWSFDPALAQGTGTALPTAGIVHLVKIPIRAPRLVTGIRINLTAGGGTLTSGQNFVGLINSAGTQIGTSADQTSAWGSSGTMDANLVGGPFTVSPPFVWVAIVFNGTTGPSLVRGFATLSTGINGKAAVSVARYGTILTGQTAIPASITPASIALAGNPWYAALF